MPSQTVSYSQAALGKRVEAILEMALSTVSSLTESFGSELKGVEGWDEPLPVEINGIIDQKMAE